MARGRLSFAWLNLHVHFTGCSMDIMGTQGFVCFLKLSFFLFIVLSFFFSLTHTLTASSRVSCGPGFYTQVHTHTHTHPRSSPSTIPTCTVDSLSYYISMDVVSSEPAHIHTHTDTHAHTHTLTSLILNPCLKCRARVKDYNKF